ncbi:LamG domain-containing protein [Micromonospora sp. NPDC049366]|uniref:LamG domain-containing protein n=1 Tax=Micromonospora sp. NPDC049366 TaxID=3364271 RepID=UPI00379F344A
MADAKPRAATTVHLPSAATARWGLEAYPGITQAQALADWQPAIGGDTPLTGANISWKDDARSIGVQTVGFDGASSYLSASPSALNTAGTFSLTAWVRLADTSASRIFASKASAGQATLSVGYDKASNRWQVQMPSKTGKGGKVSIVRSISAPPVGLWTHLAVGYDATARTLTLWVDGVAEATLGNVTAVNDPSGEFRLGRGDNAWWQGNLADVRVYDRVLVGQDLTGWFADDPASGGFNEPGLLRPWQVGDWGFEAATSCYEENLDPTLCSAPDSTAFGRQLALTQGSFVDSGHRDLALTLDGTHWIDDPSDPHYGEATREYARTQHNVGEAWNPVWQDGPVLRTDQSFTAAVWVRLDPTRGAQTVISQDDTDRSAFWLGYEPDNGGQWVFGVAAEADGSATTYAAAPATGVDQWHHLVVVLDATQRQARLYADGTLAQTVGMNAAWQPRQAPGAMLVGRSTTPEGPDGWLYGQVDDLGVYQGKLSDADVQRLFTEQKV